MQAPRQRRLAPADCNASAKCSAQGLLPEPPTTIPVGWQPMRKPARLMDICLAGPCLLTRPLAAAVQEICGRIGRSTGAGLAETIRRRGHHQIEGSCPPPVHRKYHQSRGRPGCNGLGDVSHRRRSPSPLGDRLCACFNLARDACGLSAICPALAMDDPGAPGLCGDGICGACILGLGLARACSTSHARLGRVDAGRADLWHHDQPLSFLLARPRRKPKKPAWPALVVRSQGQTGKCGLSDWTAGAECCSRTSLPSHRRDDGRDSERRWNHPD